MNKEIKRIYDRINDLVYSMNTIDNNLHVVRNEVRSKINELSNKKECKLNPTELYKMSPIGHSVNDLRDLYHCEQSLTNTLKKEINNLKTKIENLEYCNEELYKTNVILNVSVKEKDEMIKELELENSKLTLSNEWLERHFANNNCQVSSSYGGVVSNKLLIEAQEKEIEKLRVRINELLNYRRDSSDSIFKLNQIKECVKSEKDRIDAMKQVAANRDMIELVWADSLRNIQTVIDR